MSQVNTGVDKLKGGLPKKLEGLHLDDMTQKAKDTLSDVSNNVTKKAESTYSGVREKLNGKKGQEEVPKSIDDHTGDAAK
jgi:L-lactate utilization protein LutC